MGDVDKNVLCFHWEAEAYWALQQIEAGKCKQSGNERNTWEQQNL